MVTTEQSKEFSESFGITQYLPQIRTEFSALLSITQVVEQNVGELSMWVNQGICMMPVHISSVLKPFMTELWKLKEIQIEVEFQTWEAFLHDIPMSWLYKDTRLNEFKGTPDGSSI